MTKEAIARLPVIVVYRSRLFRDVVAGILRGAEDVNVVGVTRSRREALDIAHRLGVRAVIAETSKPVEQERSMLNFLTRLAGENPELRIVAISLNEADASLYAWRKLAHIEADQLLTEVCGP
jgi:chemotaxis response regulator CheB